MPATPPLLCAAAQTRSSVLGRRPARDRHVRGRADDVGVGAGQRQRPGVRRPYRAFDALGEGIHRARSPHNAPYERASPQARAGRADRVLPGIWRLRLPLPWPGVPARERLGGERGATGSCCSTPASTSRGRWRSSSERCTRPAARLEDMRLLVCTHAHSDHYGLAAPIVEAAGCELWMHPRHEHMTRAAADPERSLERRIEVARQSGVPLEPLRALGGGAKATRPRHRRRGRARPRAGRGSRGRDGRSAPGPCTRRPGHAPSHVVLFQPQRRLLISGDHLLGRVSLYFDYGWTPDPVAEFLASLDKVERARRPALPARSRPALHRRAGRTSRPTAPRCNERLEATSRRLRSGS